jgi:hypothetical protein
VKARTSAACRPFCRPSLSPDSEPLTGAPYTSSWAPTDRDLASPQADRLSDADPFATQPTVIGHAIRGSSIGIVWRLCGGTQATVNVADWAWRVRWPVCKGGVPLLGRAT